MWTGCDPRSSLGTLASWADPLVKGSIARWFVSKLNESKRCSSSMTSRWPLDESAPPSISHHSALLRCWTYFQSCPMSRRKSRRVYFSERQWPIQESTPTGVARPRCFTACRLYLPTHLNKDYAYRLLTCGERSRSRSIW